MLGGHEALLHISDLQVVQRQHVLLLFLLNPKTESLVSVSLDLRQSVSLNVQNQLSDPGSADPGHLVEPRVQTKELVKLLTEIK